VPILTYTSLNRFFKETFAVLESLLRMKKISQGDIPNNVFHYQMALNDVEVVKSFK
jgi:hypothetical protein